MRPIPRGAVALALAGAASVSVAAETPSFSALLERAQSTAPQLLGQSAETRAAQADAQQARAWSNPVFNATLENLSAPKSGGVSQRQDTYTLTQLVETGGKRIARIEAEQGKAAAAQARERQARLSFASELAVLYAHAEAAQQRHQIASTELVRALEDARAAQALVDAGREAQLRTVQAQASVSAARAALASAAAEATQALERLSAHVGAAAPFTQIDHPILAQAGALRLAQDWTPEQAPALASAGAERDAAKAQLQVEQKRWYPDVSVTLGMRKFAWSDEKAATVGVSASIPLFDHNRAGTDAARERAASAQYRLDALRLETSALHRSARAQVGASAERLAAAEAAERAAAEAYRLGRIGYEAGKASLTELLAIRRALSEAQTLTIDARLARIQALATLSLAEGRLVFGDTP